jgi:hypothetical protein
MPRRWRSRRFGWRRDGESYFRNCRGCGHRIHMRQMPQGHWLAFEDSDQVHDCPNPTAYDDLGWLGEREASGHRPSDGHFQQRGNTAGEGAQQSEVIECRNWGSRNRIRFENRGRRHKCGNCRADLAPPPALAHKRNRVPLWVWLLMIGAAIWFAWRYLLD